MWTTTPAGQHRGLQSRGPSGDGDDGETMLRHADTAMYECKRTRRRSRRLRPRAESLHTERLRLLSRDRVAEPFKRRITDRSSDDG